ncbi:hypothetical protein J3E69DRAFT_347736 [Trichoderma sp. SZMC 28015]
MDDSSSRRGTRTYFLQVLPPPAQPCTVHVVHASTAWYMHQKQLAVMLVPGPPAPWLKVLCLAVNPCPFASPSQSQPPCWNAAGLLGWPARPHPPARPIPG